MFISKAEKKYLFDKIRDLQQQVDKISKEKFWGTSSVEAARTQAVEQAVRTRKRSITPHGSVLKHAKPYVDGLGVGQSVEIDAVGDLTATRIQSSVGSYMGKKFGEGRFMTKILENGNLYVVRIA
jgi:hypothetical protein